MNNKENKQKENVMLRILGMIFIPFVVVYFEARKRESIGKSLIVAMVSFMIFFGWWNLLLNGSEEEILKVNVEQSKIIEKQEKEIESYKEEEVKAKKLEEEKEEKKKEAKKEEKTEKKKESTSKPKKKSIKKTSKETNIDIQLENMRESYKESSDIDYDKGTKTIRIIPKQASFMIEANAAYNGDQEALNKWNEVVELHRQLSKKFDKEIILGIVNNLNKENYLLMVQDGVVLYDFVNNK